MEEGTPSVSEALVDPAASDVVKSGDSFLLAKLGESFLGGSTERTTIGFSNINLTLKTKKATKNILKDISGTIHHSRLTALMGPSGSGKTSLLNALAGRTKFAKGLTFTGEISANHQVVTNWSQHRRRCAYVEQDDLLFHTLTIFETINLAAELRLPRSMSKTDREARVDSVIAELGLRKCRDTRIGNEMTRGISGGERKRVSIAIEILRGPTVLFLDECTTGLDSFQALRVATTIKELALGGRTVVTSIHQPRSSIFALFDDIAVLSEGRIIFFGPASRMIQYFSELGFQMPDNYNPADFVLDLVSVDFRNDKAEKATRNRLDDLGASFTQNLQTTSVDPADADPITGTDESDHLLQYKYPVSFPRQYALLQQRAFRQKLRDKLPMIIPLCTTILFSLILGFLYFRNYLNLTQEAIQDKVGCLFFLGLFSLMNGMFALVGVFPREKVIINRERSAKMYRLSAYYFSRIFADTLNLVFPTVMCIVTYFLVHFKMTAAAFFQTWFTMILSYLIGMSMVLFVGSLANSVQGAQAGVMPIMLIFILFGGFYVNNANVPPELNWIQWISPIRWIFASLITIQFPGLVFECDDGPQNCIPTGEAYMERLGLSSDSFGRSVGVLIAEIIFLQWIGYFILRKKRIRWVVPSAPKEA